MIPINYFRALFPKWSFYDEVAYQFELEFKYLGTETWHSISFLQTRKYMSLFFNPNCNLAMASVNVIEHFAIEIQAQPTTDLTQLTSFKLLTSLLKSKLEEYSKPSTSVQFRIVAIQKNTTETIYFSNFIKLVDL